ncbi:MAG: DUF1571 domain-containing protein [Phycisphaerales bacterium]|nr:DUF1571 domain-containing protein [Phycisphaerales bacterium]
MRKTAQLSIVAAVLACLTGCTAGPKSVGMVKSAEASDVGVARRQELRLKNDPIGYITEVRDRCAKFDQYTITFIRQERRGLGFLKSMQGPERILCWFRRSPFSIRMKWTDPDIKYGESTYVEGQQKDQVRFVPRNGLFGLKPGITRVSIQTPVAWGEARYTVRDFGMENMLTRTLATYEKGRDGAKITFLGTSRIGESQRLAAGLRLEYSPALFAAPIQEIYFDVETELPVGTITRFPDETIDTAYFYEDLDTTVTLSDDDFLLDLERNPPAEDDAAAAADAPPEE